MQPGRLPCQVLALGEAGRLRGRLGVEHRCSCEIPVLLVQVCRHRCMTGQRLVQFLEGRESRPRPVRLPDRDGAVEPGNGTVGEPHEFVVPLDDLRPVGLVDAGGVGVQCRYGGLRLELTEPIADERRLHDRDSLDDRLGVPPAAVLLCEGDQAAVQGNSCVSPRVVEQHECKQPRHLRMVDHGCELTGQADRLGREIDFAGVALVEDQVEHTQHRGDVAGPVESHARDRPLGATDPLRHRRLRNQICLRDLAGRQATDRAQRQRDSGRRCQRRVRAQEVECERVVHRRHRAGRRLNLYDVLAPAPGRVRASGVQKSTPGHTDQPALRVARRVRGPHADRIDQRILHGILGRREVCSTSDEDPENLWREIPKQDLVHRKRHSVTVGGAVRKGRTSSHS
ncbi:hypothetical protein RHCRD62_30131 [Rhodococcus sp. RD6.2]|nr:hypothetical protein RHCRD62_30131 [Rhodococcus sp. RD6.2]